MKPTSKIHSWLSHQPLFSFTTPVAFAAATLLVCFSHVSQAASNTWIPGGNGSYTDPTKWTGGVDVPNGAADVAAIDGNNSVVAFNTTVTLQALNLALTAAGGAPVFNQSGGTLTAGALGFGGAGGSRNPTYNLGGGTLNISSSFTWGNGTNARFNVSAGTANFNGGSLSIGVGNGSRGSINLTGGVFNANTVGQINLANNVGGDAQVTIALSGDSQFHADAATLVLGQFGAASGTNTFATLSISGNSSLTAANIVLGGNNSGSAVYGVINLTGGTITAGSIRKGNSSIAPSATAQVLHADGGTVKASTHANNSNYFLNTFVDLAIGGLKFDTNSNDVTITNVLSGVGGITKLGEGVLTLTNLNTYAGNTTVSAGTLTLGTTSLSDASTVSVAADAILNLTHGGQDQVAKVILNGTENTVTGTYGSFSSSAIFQSEFFEGTGVLRIGPVSPGRNLTWTGTESDLWEAAGGLNFTTTGIDSVAFSYNDNVAFNDSSTVTNINLFGMVYPGSVTFNGTTPYTLTSNGSPTGIAGSTGITINNTSTVSLGGISSVFTGPIAVNAGVLKPLDNKSFGATSGITIAPGAQVDLNGKAPGALYTYSISGTGPAGAGIIVNSGTPVFAASGVKNLILTGDATVGNDGSRFDIFVGGTLTGNSHTLTKIGNNGMAFRGNASGSPVNIVVTAGSIWAEDNDGALGGDTGTVLVKTGATIGSFGARTISTPITLETGTTLNNLGNGKGTWSGQISMNGNITIASGGVAADQIDIIGTITGTANLTKQGSPLVTITNPTHGGNTTVSTGQLALLSPDLADTGRVSIAATATLSLPHGMEDEVATLYLAGVQVDAGVYGAVDNATTEFTTDRIVGTGTLKVLNGPAPNGEFGTWADANVTDPANALLKGRTDDPDTDGFTNLQEFLFGTDPELNTPSLTQLTSTGGGLIVRWIQRDTGATYQLQQGTTLTENPWPASGVTPVNATDQTSLPTDYTRKQATIPVDAARKFVRVQGVEN